MFGIDTLTDLLDRQGRIDTLERAARGQRLSSPTLPLGANDPVESAPVTPVLGPDQLNERYGHLGLSFDAPMSEAAAAVIADAKRAEIVRNDTLNRAPGGISNVGYFGAGVLATMIDPLELGVSLIPFFGQARKAAQVGRVANAVRGAGVGAAEGALGNALIEPLVFGLSREQQLDYTLADSLLNVAFGAALGGSAGALGGALRRRPPDDPEGVRVTGLPEGMAPRRAVKPQPMPIPDVVARAPRQTREGAAKAAVAQMAQGRSVEVAAMLPPLPERGRTRPPSLLQELSDKGLRDEGGELARMDAQSWHRQKRHAGEIGFRRRLVRDDGMDLDTAAGLAAEAGFIPERSVRALLDAIDAEMRGERVVARENMAEEAEFVEVLRARQERDAADPAVIEATDAFPSLPQPEIEEIVDLMGRFDISPAEAQQMRQAARVAAEAEVSPSRDFAHTEPARAPAEPFDVFNAEDWEIDERLEQLRAMNDLPPGAEDELAAIAEIEGRAAAGAEVARAYAACRA